MNAERTYPSLERFWEARMRLERVDNTPLPPPRNDGKPRKDVITCLREVVDACCRSQRAE